MLDTSVLGLLRLTGKVQKALPMLGPTLQAEKDGSPRDTLVCPKSKREGRQVGGRSSELLVLNQFLAPTPYSIRTSTKILTQGLANFFHTRPDSEDVSAGEPCGLCPSSKKAAIDNVQTKGLGSNKTLFTKSVS